MSIVPVFIPMRKYLVVPNFFNYLAVYRCLIIFFELNSSCFSSLYQNGPKIVDPFSSFLCGSSFEIKSPVLCGYREAKSIKVRRNFVLLHHSWANSQSQISDIVNQQKSRCLVFRWIADPLNLCLIFTQKDPSLNKLIWISTTLQKNMSFYELFTDLNGLFDIGNSEIFESSVNCSKVVSFSCKFFLSDSLKDVSQILFTDWGTWPSCVLDELLARHLFLLFWVVSISS